MTAALNDLREFHRFVGEKLAAGGDVTPEAVLVEWRAENPAPDELAESAASLREALAEADRGEGEPLDDVIAALRRKHQLRNGAPAE